MPPNYSKLNKRESKLREEINSLRLSNETLSGSINRIEKILDSTMHEVRRFSEEISSQCEKLSFAANEKNFKVVLQRSETIFYTSGVIAARLAFTDIELNPDAIRRQTPVRAGFYKKFDKARSILSATAHAKRLRINFVGESRTEFDALRSFELVPLALLDNAVKYSPQDQEVSVLFEEELGKRVRVTVSSHGPILVSGEENAIFEQGVRGKNAEKTGALGFGLGLYLAKSICDMHGISLSVQPANARTWEQDGVEYAQFNMLLEWRR